MDYLRLLQRKILEGIKDKSEDRRKMGIECGEDGA
jgi:hypothetical protein